MKTHLFVCWILCLIFGSCTATNKQFTFSTDNYLPVPKYDKGKAIFSGQIKDYTPEMAPDIQIGIPQMVMGKSDVIYVTINEDGSFREEIPLYYSTQIKLIGKDMEQYIFLEPHKESSANISIKDGKAKFDYTGNLAELNNEYNSGLLITEFPPTYSNSLKEVRAKLYGKTPDEYKKYWLDEYHKAIEHNNQQSVSSTAKDMANISCAFSTFHNITTYIYSQIMAYGEKHNANREAAFAKYIDCHLPEGYYDFMNELPVNNPMALYSYKYRDVVEPTYYRTNENPLKTHYNYLIDHDYLTREEKELVSEYNTAYKQGEEFNKFNELMLISIKYDSIISVYQEQLFANIKKEYSQTLKEHEFFLEWVTSRSFRPRFHNFKSLTSKQEKQLNELTNPIVVGIVTDMNEQMKPKMKQNTGSIICKNPTVPIEQTLDTILNEYKGKVIFVDFWATWCGGCRQMIKEYAPIKEELAGKDIAFVYLTGTTSPLEIWKKLIPEIKGYHYRLNSEQWDYLWKKFGLKGLPMYLIVNKEGKINQRFVHVNVSGLKSMLESELKE